jgi:hypothetical protein
MTQRLVQRGSEIVPVEGGAPWAVVDARNLLVDGAREVPSGGRIVIWSGWMGEADTPRGVFERDFRTWSRGAWEKLESEVEPMAGRILIRPHARHVLSDAQSCVTFFRKHGGVALLLDPVAMLTPEMVGRAEEHLERTVGTLGGQAAAVVVSGAARVETAWGAELVSGEGAVARDLVERVVERWVPSEIPRVV